MIVVLPPEVPGPALDRLRVELAARGWQVDVSRGSENTVLLVAGPTDTEQLEGPLAGFEADILPVLELEQYQREHRRRRFLSLAIGGLMLMVLTGLLIPVWAFLQPPERSIVAAELIHVRGAEDLSVGGSLLLRINGATLRVVRLAPQRWYAVSSSCTYMASCLLDWSVERQQLVCACHGCAYDAYGNVLHAPASIPLTGYEVVESRGKLYVRRTML